MSEKYDDIKNARMHLSMFGYDVNKISDVEIKQQTIKISDALCEAFRNVGVALEKMADNFTKEFSKINLEHLDSRFRGNDKGKSRTNQKEREDR